MIYKIWDTRYEIQDMRYEIEDIVDIREVNGDEIVNHNLLPVCRCYKF